MKKDINLALISPSENAYSETFIQNHKRYIDAKVSYYYDGFVPKHLEGKGLLKPSFYNKLKYHIKETIGISSPPNFLRERALAKSFKENKIDIVYAEYGTTGVFVLPICKELNLPLIVNFHGFDASLTEIIKSYGEQYKEMFSYASCVIAVSKTMYDKLIDMGCPEHKIELVIYGVRDEFFLSKPDYSENSFLALGRFVDKKAPYYTILAFKQVVEKYKDARLYYFGDGDLWATCSNLVRYWNLENNVHLMGAKDQSEIIPYFSKVKAFVQHSITASNGDMEGSPVAIIEASAAALSVISTKHAGIPDIVVDGKTGLLVDEHDVDGMAQNMIRILEDNNMAKELGCAGRNYAKENFSMEIHINKLNKVISANYK